MITPRCFPVTKVVRYRAVKYGIVRGEYDMMKELLNGPITCGIACNPEFSFKYSSGMLYVEAVVVGAVVEVAVVVMVIVVIVVVVNIVIIIINSATTTINCITIISMVPWLSLTHSLILQASSRIIPGSWISIMMWRSWDGARRMGSSTGMSAIHGERE